MDKKNELLIRVYMVLLLFVVAALVMLFKVFQISILEGDKWRAKGEQNIKLLPIEADRGNIYSEDGNLLATSLTFFEIRMDTRAPREKDFFANLDSLSINLSKYVDHSLTPRQWKNKLKSARKKKNRYYLIARNINFEELKRIKKFPLFRKGQYRGGLICERRIRRERPFQHLAERTIGKDRLNASKIGLEGYFDKYLSGEEIKMPMKRVSPGIWIPLYDPAELEPKKGHNIVTTLDMHTQDITHQSLLSALKYHEAEAGVAIIMEVETGAIKAITNLSKNKDGSYSESFNHAIGTLSEPGSTFKLPTVLALLDDGHANLKTRVNLNGGKKRFYDHTMHDSDHHGIYSSTMEQAFEISSNVGIASLAEKYYSDNNNESAFVAKLRQFHLHQGTGVEINGEPLPYIKDPIKNSDTWSGTTLPWMSHGYELMMTPLQILNFYNTVANDGKMMKPYLVSEIVKAGDVVKKFRPKVIDESIASMEAIFKAQDFLSSAVERGTGKRLKTDNYEFAGKTGTTRVDYGDGVKGAAKSYNASFVGYFPANEPIYSCIVVVYKPQKHGYYGSSVAGPVFREIVDNIYGSKLELAVNMNGEKKEFDDEKLPKYSSGYSTDFQRVFDYIDLDYRKKTKSKWVTIGPSVNELKIEKRKIKKSSVPNVEGMGLRDAVYILENLGMEVKFTGVGKVAKQSIRPGTNIDGQTIELKLG
jgi:cell division protein FtsI (penicillin-binding protein 3)